MTRGLKWLCVRVNLVTHQAFVCLSQIAKESEVYCLQIPSAFSEEISFGIADGFLDVTERTILLKNEILLLFIKHKLVLN
jgi:hypothetical protein